jgi:hypothetical protein
MINAYNVLVERTESKIPLGRRGHGWEGNIRMDLSEKECECVECLTENFSKATMLCFFHYP